jgi:isopropylmalate/homocitrate/citramalate synthase
MSGETPAGPWHQPGRWLANPAYWDADGGPAPNGRLVRFIDTTLSEGDDCVGHQLNWNSRLELAEALAASGVDEITLPSHARYQEERDFVRAYRARGLSTPLVAKGPGISPPLRGDWRRPLEDHLALEVEVISPILKWSFEDVVGDFTSTVTAEQVIDAIGESIAFLAARSDRVVPWIVDSMRMHPTTVARFAEAIVGAGAQGVYLVDSRGNSVPRATSRLVRQVREVIGDADLYVQHHNDLGVATANALASVESGADVIDVTVLGIGDRGGCVALEEIAPLVEMYGYRSNVDLGQLYELSQRAQRAFRVEVAPWKPIAGDNWNKEEGVGHLDGSDAEEATCGLAPSVVGRRFEGVIGGKLLFGRERSSITDDTHGFIRRTLESWDLAPSPTVFDAIVERTKAAVATSASGYITTETFRHICDGALQKPTR